MSALTKEQLLEILRDGSIALVCIITLNALCGGAVLAILATPLMLLCLLPLVLLLLLLNPQARRQNGWAGVATTIPRGFIMLVPFTVLALFARFWLHWDSAQLFASSGLMAVGAAIGFELAKIGGGRFTGAILPALWFALLSIIWMLFSALVANSLAGA